eukprot:SAG11_NODE_2012_length_3924_cov_1.906667_1_plen_272_part_00
MVNRGAYLGWLSQCPHEKEILIPPLTGLEVLSQGRLADGTLLFSMGLNVNLQSQTIEEVLAVRKKQCLELAAVVRKSINDAGARVEQIDKLDQIIAERDAAEYNKNEVFTVQLAKLIGLVPEAPGFNTLLAVTRGETENAVKQLVEQMGVDVLWADPKDGRTFLMHAVEVPDAEQAALAVSTLIKCGADVNAVNHKRENVLMCAAAWPSATKCVKVLLKHFDQGRQNHLTMVFWFFWFLWFNHGFCQGKVEGGKKPCFLWGWQKSCSTANS